MGLDTELAKINIVNDFFTPKISLLFGDHKQLPRYSTNVVLCVIKHRM